MLHALVLDSKGIPFKLLSDSETIRVVIEAEHFIEAKKQLSLYETENLGWPPPSLPYNNEKENSLLTISFILLLPIFYNLIILDIPPLSYSEWMDAGSAKSHLIRYGEYWRTVTALTLHANVVHLLSNVLIGSIIMLSLSREYPPALAWFLTILAGVSGNLINAYAALPTHSSIGSSTALFGAIGLLGAISLLRQKQQRRKWWLLPAAAAAALLALLGTEGEHTDLGAHLYGFLSGVVIGLIAEKIVGLRGKPGRFLSAIFSTSSLLLVVLSWYCAVINFKQGQIF